MLRLTADRGTAKPWLAFVALGMMLTANIRLKIIHCASTGAGREKRRIWHAWRNVSRMAPRQPKPGLYVEENSWRGHDVCSQQR
jgi:hypothetical protein